MKRQKEGKEHTGTSAALAFGRPARIPPDTDTQVKRHQGTIFAASSSALMSLERSPSCLRHTNAQMYAYTHTRTLNTNHMTCPDSSSL